MSKNTKIDSLQDFAAFCEKEFKDIPAKDILFALGAGFDMAIYKKSPSWDLLNKEILEELGNEYVNLLDEPRIKHLGPNLISTYISEKINKKISFDNGLKASLSGGRSRNDYVSGRISDIEYQPEVKTSIEIIARSFVNIITTNYRAPKEFETKRSVIDLTRKGQKSIKSKMIYAHGHKMSNSIIFSDDDFSNHYEPKNFNKMSATLKRQDIKYVFMIGFSGQDGRFLRLIKAAFGGNEKIKIFFLTGDFIVNPLEEEMFSDLMKTVYELNVISYPHSLINASKMLETILLSSKGNKKRIITDAEWDEIIDSATKSKRTKIDYVNDKIKSPSNSYSLNVLAEKILLSGISMDDIKSSSVTDFLKEIIVEKMITELRSVDEELIEYYFELNKNSYWRDDLKNKLLNLSLQSKKSLFRGMVIYRIKIQESSKEKSITAEEYGIAVEYMKSIAREGLSKPFIHKWPRIISKSLSDVSKVIKSYLSYSGMVLSDLLNIREGREISSVVNSISNAVISNDIFMNELQAYAKRESKILTKTIYDGKFPLVWIIAASAIIKTQKETRMSDIWENNDLNLLSIATRYLKFEKYKLIIDIDGTFPELYKKPEEHHFFGMSTKDKKWQENMILFINSGESWISKYPSKISAYKTAIMRFDNESVIKIENEIMYHWSSRTLGDGQVTFAEKNFETLMKEDWFDISHVYLSWTKDKSIRIDKKIFNLFTEIENSSLSDLIRIKEKYPKVKNLVKFLDDKYKSEFSKKAKNRELSFWEFGRYIDDYISFDNKFLLRSKKENDYHLFYIDNREFFDLIKENFFTTKKIENDREIPEWEKNERIFEKIISKVKLSSSEKSILRLKYTYYIYKDIKHPEKIIQNLGDDSEFGWHVLTSNITYYRKEDNNILVDLYNRLGIKIKVHKDDVDTYNNKFNIVHIHYYSGRVSEIVNKPELVDILLEFVYRNKHHPSFKEYNREMNGADFSLVKLWRFSDEKLGNIPLRIFKKIVQQSKVLTLERLIDYSRVKPKIEDYQVAIDRVTKGEITYENFYRHDQEADKSIFAIIARTTMEKDF